MIFISAMLVLGAGVNMKIYDAAESFKLDADGKPARSGMMLGLRPAGVNTMAMLLSIIGSVSVGMFGLSVAYKQSGVVRAKAPSVATAVFGFAVALALMLSGISMMGLDKQVEVYSGGDDNASARARGAARGKRGAPVVRSVARSAAASKKYNAHAKIVGGLSVALGSVVLGLFIARIASPVVRRTNRVVPLSGGRAGASTFFTY